MWPDKHSERYLRYNFGWCSANDIGQSRYGDQDIYWGRLTLFSKVISKLCIRASEPHVCEFLLLWLSVHRWKGCKFLHSTFVHACFLLQHCIRDFSQLFQYIWILSVNSVRYHGNLNPCSGVLMPSRWSPLSQYPPVVINQMCIRDSAYTVFFFLKEVFW